MSSISLSYIRGCFLIIQSRRFRAEHCVAPRDWYTTIYDPSCQIRTDKGSAYEQRSFRSTRSKEQPTSQSKQCLLFPRSDKQALLQSSIWHPRGTDNRIKIILSERLVNEDDALEAGVNDIVCFSFQHAPRGIQSNLTTWTTMLTQARTAGAGWYRLSHH